jgi:hypothetical protein
VQSREWKKWKNGVRIVTAAVPMMGAHSCAHAAPSVVVVVSLSYRSHNSTDICMRSGADTFSPAVPRSAMQQVREDCNIRTVKNPASKYAPKVCAASPLKRKRQKVEGHHFGGCATSKHGAE